MKWDWNEIEILSQVGNKINKIIAKSEFKVYSSLGQRLSADKDNF